MIPGLDDALHQSGWTGYLIAGFLVLNTLSHLLEWVAKKTTWTTKDDRFVKTLTGVVNALRVLVNFLIAKQNIPVRLESPENVMEQGKIVLVGMPEHTVAVLNAISRKTGKSLADILSEAIDQKAKSALGDDYLQKISA